MRTTLLRLLSPAEQVLALLASSNRLLTLFLKLLKKQSWYIFCINPNDSQLPNQLEGQSVKGQVKAVGMTEMARRCINVFEVGMTPEEFCDRYRDGLTTNGVTKGNEREMVGQARNVFGLGEKDLVLGTTQSMACSY